MAKRLTLVERRTKFLEALQTVREYAERCGHIEGRRSVGATDPDDPVMQSRQRMYQRQADTAIRRAFREFNNAMRAVRVS